ncbi:hypothetical protein VTI74DRAFT_6184 [Chaetomium olivicolor]
MIVRDLKRVALLVGPLVVLLLLTASLWHTDTDYLRSRVSSLLTPSTGKTPAPQPASINHRPPTLTSNGTHREIYSVSTADGKYFEIRFGKNVYNPNVIPHQHYPNTWYVVGQLWNEPTPANSPFFEPFREVKCLAQFIKGALMCFDFLVNLPIEPTTGDKCEGDIAHFRLNVGPHDARVFFGPQVPYTVYGSNSGYTCFGIWIQDFRKLVDWGKEENNNTNNPLPTNTDSDFAVGTEIQRPGQPGPIEKNYFLFWNSSDAMFAHYDIFPKRAFASLSPDGSAGPDMAAATAAGDERCLARYLPQLPPKLESFHQATNSLRVTMCNRTDPTCTPDDSNTFIMTVIQHKTFYNYHAEYEPYVVLFHQRAPYELYAISKQPLWISGRQRREGRRTEMFYVTSANWKENGLKYHGYLDDVVVLGFGIEDQSSGGIDVLAADLVMDLGQCDEAGDENGHES